MQKLQTLIVEQDNAARLRLKSALSALPEFGAIQWAAAGQEALGRLSAMGDCDVVLVSSRLESDIASFLEAARRTVEARDAAFVLIMKANDQDASTVARSALQGIDGFLVEPYSVKSLGELIELTMRVRRDRALSRQRVALTLLLKQVIDQIDVTACLKGNGYGAVVSMKTLEEMCLVLRTLDADGLSVYFELLTELFEAAPCAAGLSNPRLIYKGSSKRVREQMEKKLMLELRQKKLAAAS